MQIPWAHLAHPSFLLWVLASSGASPILPSCSPPIFGRFGPLPCVNHFSEDLGAWPWEEGKGSRMLQKGQMADEPPQPQPSTAAGDGPSRGERRGLGRGRHIKRPAGWRGRRLSKAHRLLIPFQGSRKGPILAEFRDLFIQKREGKKERNIFFLPVPIPGQVSVVVD
jgi:hypothetical protein